MGNAIEGVLVLIFITNLMLLGSSYLSSCIRIVALQGVVAGILPLLVHDGSMARALGLSLVTMSLKGAVFPWLLSRVLREADVRREVEPFVGYTLSMGAGVAALFFSLWLSSRLNLSLTVPDPLMVPAGLTTLLVGLFLIVSRRKALNQVLGYIVMENGIYVFGLALVGRIPMLIELGVLMDAFVAVFIMSIAAYHISREFDHTDVDQLDSLKG